MSFKILICIAENLHRDSVVLTDWHSVFVDTRVALGTGKATSSFCELSFTFLLASGKRYFLYLMGIQVVQSVDLVVVGRSVKHCYISAHRTTTRHVFSFVGKEEHAVAGV